MLDVKDPVWAELEDALGKAAPVAELVERLAAVPIDDTEYECWDEIWGRLCRQDTIYTASYAFVPHVVRLAQARPPAGRTMYLAFVGRVEMLRRLTSAPAPTHAGPAAPPVPKAVEAGYVDALQTARDLVLATLRHPTDVENYRYLVGVLSVLSGHALFGAFLQDLDGVECPECKAMVDMRTPG